MYAITAADIASSFYGRYKIVVYIYPTVGVANLCLCLRYTESIGIPLGPTADLRILNV